MEGEALKDFIVQQAEDQKAVNTRVFDVRKLTPLTDFMVIVSGNSTRHVQSIARIVVEKCKENNVDIIGVEGEDSAEWILVDAGDVVLHVMLPQTRDFYQLEKLWSMESDSSAETSQ